VFDFLDLPTVLENAGSEKSKVKSGEPGADSRGGEEECGSVGGGSEQ
jgi:hypothetical protein